MDIPSPFNCNAALCHRGYNFYIGNNSLLPSHCSSAVQSIPLHRDLDKLPFIPLCMLRYRYDKAAYQAEKNVCADNADMQYCAVFPADIL